MKTRIEHGEFILHSMTDLAACAWNGSQASGRGFVIVDCDQWDENLRMVPFQFLPLPQARKIVRGWSQSHEKRMVLQYDPDREMVVMFSRTTGPNKYDLDTYRCICATTPPQAADLR